MFSSLLFAGQSMKHMPQAYFLETQNLFPFPQILASSRDRQGLSTACPIVCLSSPICSCFLFSFLVCFWEASLPLLTDSLSAFCNLWFPDRSLSAAWPDSSFQSFPVKTLSNYWLISVSPFICKCVHFPTLCLLKFF